MLHSIINSRRRPIILTGQPSFERPDSQLATASQMYEDSFAPWSAHLRGEPEMDRKVWEYAFIMQAVTTYAGVGAGKRGLAFGSGKEIIPSIFAAKGCEIVVTDYVPDISDRGWEARGLNDLHYPDIIERNDFERLVSFRHQDMNYIDDDLRDFDFIWSTGSLEHIGSHANGLAFVENAMRCLKPGGIAVHTTEFTVSSETKGRDHPDLSFYCRKDIENLAMRLLNAGHYLALNFTRGNTLADTHVEVAPYGAGQNLNVHFLSHVITPIGLIIQKDGIRQSF